MGVFRLAPSHAAANGTTLTRLSFGQSPLGSGPGQVLAGSTWAFQCWYRDVGGPGGQTFNYSDGLSIRFSP